MAQVDHQRTMRGSEPEQAGPFQRALVVANPISGRGKGAGAARELVAGLQSAGLGAELFLTGKRGDAFTRLRTLEPGVDFIVSVGGDGTLREVLEGLVDPEIPVGLLPLGTANVLGHELGYPRDIHRIIEILLGGKVQRLDVARANGTLSFLVTGVGIDAMAVQRVEARRRGPITKFSYVRAMVETLWGYRPPELRVEVDGRELPGSCGFVLISNTRNYGGVLNLDPDARLDDGLFEVYSFPTGRRRELLRVLLRGTLHHLPGAGVQMHRARSVRVSSDQPVPFEIDGDSGGETPLELVLGATQYRLLAP